MNSSTTTGFAPGGLLPAPQRPLSPSHIRKVIQAKSMIELHVHQKVSLREVSRDVLMCASDLQRAFRAHTGYTIGKYGKIKRIERAKELLLTQRCANVQEIAADVGYADESSLAREFRKMTGLTPTAFREKYSPASESDQSKIRVSKTF